MYALKGWIPQRTVLDSSYEEFYATLKVAKGSRDDTPPGSPRENRSSAGTPLETGKTGSRGTLLSPGKSPASVTTTATPAPTPVVPVIQVPPTVVVKTPVILVLVEMKTVLANWKSYLSSNFLV